MRYLFFPIEIGIAHASRSLAIAEKLQEAGHEVIFALPKKRHALYESSPVKLTEIPAISDSEGVQLIAEFRNRDRAIDLIKSERSLIKKYKPDWCVVDYRLTAVVSSIQETVPFMYVTGSGGLAFGSHLPNPLLPSVVYSLSKPLVRIFVNFMLGIYFSSLEDASESTGERVSLRKHFETIPHIVPEIPEYLPSLREDLQIAYVGHLRWDGFKSKKPEWLSRIHPDGKTVYLTFGGTGFDKEKLIRLANRLVDEGLRVIVSSSSIADPSEFPKHKNLFVERYLSGEDVSKCVDVVVCHGGYGTIIEAAMAGKPVVCIPFNPDQLLHALRFRELHFGEVPISIGPKDYINFALADLEKVELMGKRADVERIIQTTKNVLKNYDSYTKHIKPFAKKYKDYEKNINLPELIESF